ncbi:MAG: P-loop NTPase fold protein [Wujia sp.]
MKSITEDNVFEKMFAKAKEKVESLTIISVIGILLYRIEALRKLCKEICLYFTKWYIDIDLNVIKKMYLGLETIFRVIIILFLVLKLLDWIVETIWERWLKKQSGKGRFEESLFRYLNDAKVSHCFLLTGEWGTGKTYDVQKFFHKYYRHSKTNVYRISCFGLDSREVLEREINKTIEQSDTSFRAFIIKGLRFLPVVGDVIAEFFRKTYSYNSAKEGSIFIFDDFERITSKAIVNERPSHLYQKNHSLLSGATGGRNKISDFVEIKKEFESVEKGFVQIENSIIQNLERKDIDKYNIAVGLINDIADIYGMKAIIICNSEVLGDKFIHDILRSKLNCLEFKKTLPLQAQYSMIDNCINNMVLENKEKQDLLNKYLVCLKEYISKSRIDSHFDNLRLFGGLLEAFVHIAEMFDKNDLSLEFLNSLFNSIMVTHVAFYNKKIECLDSFRTGASIEFMMKLFGENSINFIRTEKDKSDIKWIDITVSGYWIFNLSYPQGIADIVDEWQTYKYFATEEELCKIPLEQLDTQNFNMLHVLYRQKKVDIHNKDEWDYRYYVDEALKKYELDKMETVQRIIDDMGRIFHGAIYQDFMLYLFSKLIQGHEDERVTGNTYIHQMYNTYCEKGTLH